MRLILISVMFFLAASVFSQNTPWLDPATYMPKAMDCIATDAMIADYSDYCHGKKTYTVRQTNNGSDPVIDGILEDSIWYYADTLLMNSWADAGTQACGDNPRFKGPQDLHAIWRFCYNQNALYLSCETHDDIWDVDSLKGWNAQDGVELAIDPWDWGYYLGSTIPSGGWPKEDFRRYWSNNSTIIPYPGDAQMCLLHLHKRANIETYMAGFIRGTLLNNYNRGDEGINFTLGNYNLYEIKFAAQKRGTDDWGRTVFHYEFKFPYTSDLWKELKGTGFYNENKMPAGGQMFKMNFANNDDDAPGPDGVNGNTSFLIRSRNFKNQDDPFVNYDAHWSDTRYMMTFKYGGQPAENIHPWPPSDIKVVEHGHRSIFATWVDAATETTPYEFTEAGTSIIDNITYFYDSLAGNSNSGKITNVKGGQQVGTYTVVRINPNYNMRDTLKLTMGGTTYTLLRRINTGFDQLEKRWVQARVVSTFSSECSSYDTTWVPISGAKEYRFCPLSKIDKAKVTDPAYQNCTDSVRIYDYEKDSLLRSYSYTPTQAIIGRDSAVFKIEIKKLVHESNPAHPKDPYNLIITYNNDNSVDTLVEIQTYPTIQFNATAKGDLGRLQPIFAKNAVDSITKLLVLDKFVGNIMFFPDTAPATQAATRVYGTFYNDGMVLLTDNSRSNFWTKLCNSKIIIDTNYLVGYDPLTPGSGTVVPKVQIAW